MDIFPPFFGGVIFRFYLYIIDFMKRKKNIFLLTGLRIYTGEYKAQGPTLCPTEGRASRGPLALDSSV